MVIATARVSGDEIRDTFGGLSRAADLRFASVSARNANDAARSTQDTVPVEPLANGHAFGIRKPVHFAAHARPDEILVGAKVSIEFHVGTCPGNSDGVKTKRACRRRHLIGK
jgi:hypothetical protein